MTQCKVCCVEFQPKRPNQIYCTSRCTNKANMRRRRGKPIADETRPCRNCGQPFQAVKTDKVYCSKNCARNYHGRRSYQTAMYGAPLEITDMKKDRYAAARAAGYRSGLEIRTAKDLDVRCPGYLYEPYKLKYVQPAKDRTYTPDYVLPNGIVIDTKGRWVTEDRQKFKLLVEQHPDLDLRIVFSNAHAKIGKTSKTTYAMYAAKIGIPFANKEIPQAWIDEPPCPKRLAAIDRLRTS